MRRRLPLIRVLAIVGIAAASAPVVLLGTSSSSAAPTASRCEPGDIEVVYGQPGAGLGHWAATLLIVDPGARTCTFKGYPTVRAYESTKHWVTARRTPSGYMGGLQSGQTIQAVTLSADVVASFKIEGTDVPVGNAKTCPTYVRIVVALPGWPPSVNLPLGNFACSPLEVHPIVYGPTGDQPVV